MAQGSGPAEPGPAGPCRPDGRRGSEMVGGAAGSTTTVSPPPARLASYIAWSAMRSSASHPW